MLQGRRVAVVGATGGIGSAVVDELATRGAEVLATGRDAARLRALAGAAWATLTLDLADPAAGERLRRALPDARLDALVVAAGALGPIGPTRAIDPAGLEAALREGPVAALRLVQAVAPLLDAAPAPAVVLFSGGGATDAFPRFSAYALCKVAIVRLVENLAAEEPRWKVNAVAPGFVASRIHDALEAAGPELAGPYYAEATERLRQGGEPPGAAAELVAFLVGPESAGISGRLVSAVWDPWREPEGRSLLRDDASFGRLRRIDRQRYVEREVR